MMKVSMSLALIVIVSLVASSNALPAKKRMVYYKQNAQWYSSPQRTMYVQYVQPGQTHARSTQATSTLVAGETVATGTYLDGNAVAAGVGVSAIDTARVADAATVAGAYPKYNASATKTKKIGVTVDLASSGEQQDLDVLEVAAAHGAHSVAEAYPDDYVPQEVEIKPEGDAVDERAVKVTKASGGIGVSVGGVDVSVGDAGFVSDASPTSDEVVPATPAAPSVSVTVQSPVKTHTGAKAPFDFNLDAIDAMVPLLEMSYDLSAPAPLAPIVPADTTARRYLPSKKKIHVELETAADGDAVGEDESKNAVGMSQEAEVEEDDTYMLPVPVTPVTPRYPDQVPSARRSVVKKPVKPYSKVAATPDCSSCAKVASSDCGGCTRAAQPGKPSLPAGTFFPIDFGGTNGGAIAIANSFSTGEGGSATSHAIAYGSPESARARVRPSKIH